MTVGCATAKAPMVRFLNGRRDVGRAAERMAGSHLEEHLQIPVKVACSGSETVATSDAGRRIFMVRVSWNEHAGSLEIRQVKIVSRYRLVSAQHWRCAGRGFSRPRGNVVA